MIERPRTYLGVMVSSTFTDLEAHREELFRTITSCNLLPKMMEFDGARVDADVIDSSLNSVRTAAAYIGIISHKYGQTPYCSKRNPDRLSITELEFNEAMRLNRPILLFLMSDEHDVKAVDVEQDSEKLIKLRNFRERAKKIRDGSEVERVYEIFDSKEDFARKAERAVWRLADFLRIQDDQASSSANSQKAELDDLVLPGPPELRAVPRYLGSHLFVGRTSELETLDEWASASDPDPMMLFDAIGGVGKSILTWEWITKQSTGVRQDWAGRFWYSFYERGGQMFDFCREAVAYITSRPAEDFSKTSLRKLSERLIYELEQRPWLIVLDGLERILVAYHRVDAAQLRDEEADTTKDQIAQRDPTAAIRPQDDKILRLLTAARPSKILISSRLTPQALINSAGTPVPGVRREVLQGLQPQDAEALMRNVGVQGDSEAIQEYVRQNCGCHPLVVGALAGLVNDHLADRGNFDAWVVAPEGGRKLQLGHLDLTQRRNHILDAAMNALAPEALKLLQTLAILQRGADFDLLTAINPHMPTEFAKLNELADADRIDAGKQLNATVRDLERRGLLQYEPVARRFDLHPVVRGVAIGRMQSGEMKERGEEVVNYFTSQTYDPWDQAEDLEDLVPGIQLVSTLNQIGRFDEAYWIVSKQGLTTPLLFTFESNAECLMLLKSFFPEGWEADYDSLDASELNWLLNESAIASSKIDRGLAIYLYEFSTRLKVTRGDMQNICVGLVSFCWRCLIEHRLSRCDRLGTMAHDLAGLTGYKDELFISGLLCFEVASQMGDVDRANRIWSKLEVMGRSWRRSVYRPGKAELDHAYYLFRRGILTEAYLSDAEQISVAAKSRSEIRNLAILRGRYNLGCDKVHEAVESLEKATRMAREVRQDDTLAEALFALARFRAGHIFDARAEAQRLALSEGESLLPVAELLHELGYRDYAISVALRAHQWAIAEGEPYVRRYELDCTRELLSRLGAELPKVPRYDPMSDQQFDWEKDIKNIIKEQGRQRKFLAAQMEELEQRLAKQAEADGLMLRKRRRWWSWWRT